MELVWATGAWPLARPMSGDGPANVNPVAAPARIPVAAPRRRARAAWPAGTWAWFAALLSLLLAGNLVTCRYLFWDAFYDLYAGRYILQHGIPHQNLITVASHGAAWEDQQWLAQVLSYATWAAGGYGLLAAASAILVTAGFGLLALLMLRRGVPPVRAFAWTAAAYVVALGSVGIRAQSFAYPCFALVLVLLLADDRSPRLRPQTWLVIPVLVLWANLHGSVLLGAGLACLYAGYRAVKASARREYRAVPAFLAFAVAAGTSVVCTPYGAGVIQDYARFIGNPELTHTIVEWARPSPLDPYSWAFFALIPAVVTRRRARVAPRAHGRIRSCAGWRWCCWPWPLPRCATSSGSPSAGACWRRTRSPAATLAGCPS